MHRRYHPLAGRLIPSELTHHMLTMYSAAAVLHNTGCLIKELIMYTHTSCALLHDNP